MENLERIGDPVAEPVTLAEVKEALRIDGTDEDAYLSTLISAAREYVENHTHLALTYSRWKFTLDGWPDGGEPIELPKRPLVVIAPPGNDADPLEKRSPLVSYINGTTVETTNELVYGNDFLAKNSNPPTVDLYDRVFWPSILTWNPYPISVEFVAGYSLDGARVPPALKQAIKQLVGHWYLEREVGDIPPGVKTILRMFDSGAYL